MLPPLIDSHVHWRDPKRNRYEPLSDAVDETGSRGGAEPKPYLPTDYLADAGEFEIVGIVHVEAEWTRTNPVGESRWLQHLVDTNATEGLKVVAVGYADLGGSEVDATLKAHADVPIVRGIRQILNRVPNKPELCWADREHLDDPSWRAGYAQLAKYGLAFDLMCFAHQIAPFVRVAARHPEIPVHLEHAALPWDHSEEGRRIWREAMQTLADLPHADVKISGLGNTIPDWTEDKIRRYVLETIEIFGTDRVSFASNFPTDRRFGDMRTIWESFDNIAAEFSACERQAMFFNNALCKYEM